MVIFSGLLSSSDRATAARSKPTAEMELLPEFIYDEAQLPCIPPERPNLRELNVSLEALAAVFPDIQIEVFRELLSNFDGESRLALVANALLKNRVDWVKGRWRVVDDKQQDGQPPITRADLFRSEGYMDAARMLAAHEFRGLTKSTVTAVLAESNYSYLDARRTLVNLSSKSWRSTLQSLFTRRKPSYAAEAENHPLVVWRSTGQGSIVPTIRTTGNPELDRELYDMLVRPLKEQAKQDREAADRQMAVDMNAKEADEAGATHECACCFVDYTFEEFTSCSSEGHMVCFRCVRSTLKEALFGQGWQSSVNAETGTLKCLAVEGGGCAGHISSEYLNQAFADDKSGAEILQRLDHRLAEHSLMESKMPLASCPFCSYAEIDDIYLPKEQARPRLRFKNAYNLAIIGIMMAVMIILSPFALLVTLICLGVSVEQRLWGNLGAKWRRAMRRHHRRCRGNRFECRSPRCGRVSCLSCHKAWTDVHVCNESALVALRTQVEQAMSMAVKRVCPRCNTSFVKNAGCNKLTCPCGYKMCYVCRADLRDEGYRHFCDHFRPDGDPRPCTQCDRCNLWESEDVDAVLKEARQDAERKWQETEKRNLSGAEKAYLETGVASETAVGLRQLRFDGLSFRVENILDVLVDTLYF